MAQFTASVAETCRVFGVAPSNKWGDYAWNAFIWGEGTAQIPVYVYAGVAETQPSTSTADAAAFIVVSESIAESSSLDHAYVLDSQGYYRVFPDRTTDGEGADYPTWSSGAATAPTWTSVAVAAPTWS